MQFIVGTVGYRLIGKAAVGGLKEWLETDDKAHLSRFGG